MVTYSILILPAVYALVKDICVDEVWGCSLFFGEREREEWERGGEREDWESWSQEKVNQISNSVVWQI